MRKRKFELLVVEDDSADVDLIKEALSLSRDRAVEINLSVVENGEGALHFLKKANTFQNVPTPDLVILDLNMPRKGGLEVLKEMKADDTLKSIPVIVLTTSNAYDDVKDSYRLGANSFITKAKDFEEFSKIVKTIEEYWFNVVTLSPS